MTEEFIHYLWRFQLLKRPLFTVNHETIEIFSIGNRNKDSGPDYLNARIRIAGTLWAGDVEIHVKASDWNGHGHSGDRSYDGVILHVVYENDRSIERFDTQEIPTLEIQNIFDPQLYEKYAVFLASLDWVPCEYSACMVAAAIWEDWFLFLAEERLSRKSEAIDSLFIENKGHLELSLYQSLASGYGQKVNVSPFEWLSKIIDLKVVMKYQDDIFSLEALCFGQAGFLSGEPVDDYQEILTKQYEFFRGKYHLEPMPVHVWKFLRMRPSGFPTIRIAQWAAFLHQNAHKLSHLLKMTTAEELIGFFHAETSSYWWDHYHFNRKSKFLPQQPGNDTVLMVLLNSFIPFLYVYGCRTGENDLIKKSIEFLKILPSENNSVIRKWKSIGVASNHALASQALLELKNQYCDRKNCLHCAIGNHLLRKES